MVGFIYRSSWRRLLVLAYVNAKIALETGENGPSKVPTRANLSLTGNTGTSTAPVRCSTRTGILRGTFN